jgi:hypothetical protein
MNGWTNHETWLVNLWLGDSFVEQAEGGQKITEDFIRQTVDCLHDSVQNLDPLLADLLSTALGSINYRELEKHYMSDDPTDEDDYPDDDDYPEDDYPEDRAEYHERIDMGRNEAGEWLGFM